MSAGPALAPVPLPRRSTASESTTADVRAALSITVALAVIGALLGLVWSAWSPPGPRAYVIAPGAIQPDETEAWVAADGRFLVLAGVVGLVAGLLAWTRRRNRGPLVLGALAVGGLAGSLLMWLVGRLTGGGTADGKANTLIDQLPLTLHSHGLLFLEPGLAVLVYGLLVAFAVRDDLGRPDPVRDETLAARSPFGPGGPWPPPMAPYPPSVGPGDHPQYGGGDGDAAGGLQQRDLPPQ